MRMDSYDKWLVSAADSQYGDDESSREAYQDEVVIGCMNGDDELPEFLTEDCAGLNSEATQILAHYHYSNTPTQLSGEDLKKIAFTDPKYLTLALKFTELFYNKFVESVDSAIEYRMENQS